MKHEIILIFDVFSDKREFYIGSRYGRSQQLPKTTEEKSSETPRESRNDRFFLGSRYGKRSQASFIDEPQMKCVFTGESNLFRCIDLS
jgi:hypothetical protein